MQKIIIALSVMMSVGIIWIAFNFNGNDSTPLPSSNAVVREENGVQYIRVLARSGYSPRQITAKADVPTVLEIETKGTYDCSAAFTLPQLGYQEFLPATGITKIEIPKELAMNSITGLCSMGMYSFTLDFQS